MELFTTLGLVAVISLVAAPKMGEIRSQYDLSTATNQLAFEISRARMQAIGQSLWVRVVPVGSAQYAREVSSDGVTYVREELTTLPNQVSLSVVAAGGPVFTRTGLATTGTSLTLSRLVGDRSMSKTIQVSIIGKVSVS